MSETATPPVLAQIAHHQAAIARHTAAIGKLLGLGTKVLRQGDAELAAVLLPAWWSELGSESVTVGDLYNAHPDTRLSSVLNAHRNGLEEPRKAAQLLGQALARFAACGQPVAGYWVGRLGIDGGAVVWTLKPTDSLPSPA